MVFVIVYARRLLTRDAGDALCAGQRTRQLQRRSYQRVDCDRVGPRRCLERRHRVRLGEQLGEQIRL